MRCCSTPLLHSFVKLGPEGALTGALAALDIALWDLKGKLFDQPIYKLLGGAWRTSLPFYASIGGNGERSVDEVLRVVEARLKDKPGGGQDPLRQRPHQARRRHPRRHRQGARGAASWSATASRSPSTPITATRSAARSASGARSKSSAIGGSRSRCSTTT